MDDGGRAELASNLLLELLVVREDLRRGEITKAEALKRVQAVRTRRTMNVADVEEEAMAA